MSNTRNYLGQDINTKNLAPSASESQKGLIEIATTAEAKALMDNTRAMTPASIASIIATTAQAQGLTDDKTIITPKKLADAFKGSNNSIANPGFQILPSGLILQYGTGITTSATDDTQVTFPIAFPNDVVSIFVSEYTEANPSTYANVEIYAIVNRNTTGFRVGAYVAQSGAKGNGANFHWFAIGR